MIVTFETKSPNSSEHITPKWMRLTYPLPVKSDGRRLSDSKYKYFYEDGGVTYGPFNTQMLLAEELGVDGHDLSWEIRNRGVVEGRKVWREQSAPVTKKRRHSTHHRAR